MRQDFAAGDALRKVVTRVPSRLGRDESNLLRKNGATATGTERKSACTVRVTVKLRPDEYDELS
jgi:hypothetical protein